MLNPTVPMVHGAAELSTGTTVLLLHAGGERREVWRPVADLLATNGLGSVAYDLPGHGENRSEGSALEHHGEAVAAMIRHHAPVVAVGVSLGGLATLRAMDDPLVVACLAGVVLVDVVPHLEPDRVRSWLEAQGLRSRNHDLIEDILTRTEQLEATLAGSSIPIALVRAGSGSPLDDGDISHLLASRPDAEIRSVPEAGHLVARDAPEPLARIVADLLYRWTDASDPRPSR